MTARHITKPIPSATEGCTITEWALADDGRVGIRWTDQRGNKGYAYRTSDGRRFMGEGPAEVPVEALAVLDHGEPPPHQWQPGDTAKHRPSGNVGMVHAVVDGWLAVTYTSFAGMVHRSWWLADYCEPVEEEDTDG